GGASLACVPLRDSDSALAAGAHFAPGALAGEVARGAHTFGRDLVPVALEFFGDELGKAGEGALAHLGASDADDTRVVRLDRDPDVDFGRAVLRDGLADERRFES